MARAVGITVVYRIRVQGQVPRPRTWRTTSNKSRTISRSTQNVRYHKSRSGRSCLRHDPSFRILHGHARYRTGHLFAHTQHFELSNLWLDHREMLRVSLESLKSLISDRHWIHFPIECHQACCSITHFTIN